MRRLVTCAVRSGIALVFLLLIGTAAFLFLAREFRSELGQRVVDALDQPASLDASPAPFVVNAGESAAVIGERLEARGLIRSATLFRLLTSYYGVSAKLEAGTYELQPNMTTAEIISILRRGLVKTTMLTVPEGWRITEMDDALSKKGIFLKGDFVKAVGDSVYSHDFLAARPPGASLEGYLFPDTYKVPPTFTPRDLVDLMLDNFGQRLTPAMRRKAAVDGWTLHEVVTLASIVEREAVVASERPLIASVFINRLELGMPLQADPTVQYALANDSGSVARNGFWKFGLTLADLDVVSMYNTYRNRGLPPGPICNPGLASIEAVLEPEKSDFLYFVAKDGGSHAFAKTLDEHERNIYRYRR